MATLDDRTGCMNHCVEAIIALKYVIETAVLRNIWNDGEV
jgi:hypothetical protein